ncbi:MAG: OmpA family protein [Gemmatimonadota bacterium]|nr:OmpA family protein [Gemmatimonadota bacterium]
MTAHRLSVAALVLVMTVAACRPEPPPPPPAPTGPTEEELAQMRADSIARARADSIAAAEAAAERARAEAERLAAEQRAMRMTLEQMVNFDYDESAIRPDAESVLREKVDILRANPSVSLAIEGHADERGSTEYNLALGSRRAESVRTFLTGFGLDEGRFATSSRGEEEPLVAESNEEAWAQNRRAQFTISGDEDLVSPR